jgi:hypothetical protein
VKTRPGIQYSTRGLSIAASRSRSLGMTGEWVDFLLSEAVLPRLGVLDLRIIGNLARVKLPIISIGLNRYAVCGKTNLEA